MSFEQQPPQDPSEGSAAPPPDAPPPQPSVGTGPTTAYPTGETSWGAPSTPAPASPYAPPPPPPPAPAYAGGVQGGPGQAPPPYPGYAYGAAPAQSQNAVIALVLAILSWVFCPLVLAIVALVLASKAKAEIAASGGRIGGDGLVTAARVISWLNIALWGIFAAFMIFALVFGLFAATQVPTVVVPTPEASITFGA